MLLRTIGIYVLTLFFVLLALAVVVLKVLFLVWCVKFAIGVVG